MGGRDAARLKKPEQINGGWDMRIKVALLIALAPTITSAQVEIPQETSVAHYNACFNFAVRNKAISNNRNDITYKCYDSVAQSWFDSINEESKELRTKGGLYLNKEIPGVGFCMHGIENADGTSASFYFCGIITNKP
jgi:hypothetical protein